MTEPAPDLIDSPRPEPGMVQVRPGLWVARDLAAEFERWLSEEEQSEEGAG